MVAGSQPTAGSVNSLAGIYTIALRDAVENVINFNDYVSAAGGQAFLTTGLGIPSEDASALIAAFGNMAAWCQSFRGAAYSGPALPFDFKGNSRPLWGGQ